MPVNKANVSVSVSIAAGLAEVSALACRGASSVATGGRGTALRRGHGGPGVRRGEEPGGGRQRRGRTSGEGGRGEGVMGGTGAWSGHLRAAGLAAG